MKGTIRGICLLLVLVLCVTAGGCVNKGSYCVKIGKHSVSAGMYIYQLQQQKTNYLSQNSLTESKETWSQEYDENMNLGQYIQTTTLDLLVSNLVWRAQFERLGLSFTPQEQATIEANIAEMTQSAGGKKAVEATLKENGIGYDEYVQAVYYDTQKILKVVDYYYGEAGLEPVSQEEILSYFKDNYARCKHILISTVDGEGNTFTDDAMKNARAKAQSVFEKAKSADAAAFEKLIKEYNEDEGMASYPEGYVFSTGEMVPEFEEAAFDMAVGETRLVQTEYGFHIIRKLSLEDESIFTSEIRQKMLMDLKNQEIAAMFATWREDFPAKVNGGVLKKYTCESVNVGEDVSAEEEEQMQQLAQQLGLEETE